MIKQIWIKSWHRMAYQEPTDGTTLMYSSRGDPIDLLQPIVNSDQLPWMRIFTQHRSGCKMEGVKMLLS